MCKGRLFTLAMRRLAFSLAVVHFRRQFGDAMAGVVLGNWEGINEGAENVRINSEKRQG